MDKQTRHIIAFHVGDRRRESAKQLWANLPEVYRTQETLYTDHYDAYTAVIPVERHKTITKHARLWIGPALEVHLMPRIRHWKDLKLLRRVSEVVMSSPLDGWCYGDPVIRAKLHGAAFAWLVAVSGVMITAVVSLRVSAALKPLTSMRGTTWEEFHIT